MAIQKHVFEKGEVTMEELQAAMDHNFGYPDETGSLQLGLARDVVLPGNRQR